MVSELISVGLAIQSHPKRESLASWSTVPPPPDVIGAGRFMPLPWSVFSLELKKPQILWLVPRFWSMRKLYTVCARLSVVSYTKLFVPPVRFGCGMYCNTAFAIELSRPTGILLRTPLLSLNGTVRQP